MQFVESKSQIQVTCIVFALFNCTNLINELLTYILSFVDTN